MWESRESLGKGVRKVWEKCGTSVKKWGGEHLQKVWGKKLKSVGTVLIMCGKIMKNKLGKFVIGREKCHKVWTCFKMWGKIDGKRREKVGKVWEYSVKKVLGKLLEKCNKKLEKD